MKTRRNISIALLVLLLLHIAVPSAPILNSSAEGPTPEQFSKKPPPTQTPSPGLKKQLEHQSALIIPLSAPSNDDFNSALFISGLPYQHTVNTTGATVAWDDPDMDCGLGANSNTVWYCLVLPYSSVIAADTFGSDYDTVLAVFTGTRGALNWITCSDDAYDTLQSEVVFEVEAHETYYLEVADYGSPGGGQLSLTVESLGSSISNAYIRTNIANTGDYAGRFVIGTTGGNPDTSADDNKRLLYGYPWAIWSSFTTLRVVIGSVTNDYRLGYDVTPASGPSSDGTTLTTIWEVDGIRVEQRLYFSTNPDSGNPDITTIQYQLTNVSGSQRQAGLRLMLDTMIGDNDGAPLFVPGWGRITEESTFYSVPEYWVAWESPTFEEDSLKAKGVLRRSDVTRPNRFIIAHWDDALCPGAGPGLFSNPWDYTTDPNTSITCDSAVALYYNPVTLSPGKSKSIQTLYGLAGEGGGLGLADDVVDFVTASWGQVEDISQASSDVSTVGDYFLDKLESDAVELVVDLAFNSFDLLTSGISWARVGRGLNHIRTPGYEAALHASWRGWADDTVSKHWFKPLYDAIKNDHKLLFDKTAKSMMRYYGKRLGLETAQEFATWLGPHLLPGPGTPFYDYLGAPATQLGDGYQSELLREQDDLLALLAIKDLTPQQIAAYRDDMLARQQAHQQMVTQLGGHRDLLWHSYEKAAADEGKWWKFWGPLLLKWVVIGGATLAFDGPGFYVASVGTAAVSTIYDAAKDTRALKHDEKMLDQSLRFLIGRVSDAYMEVSHNTVSALNLIRAGDSPQIADGDVSVTAMKSFGHYRLWPELWWAEESSQLELNISNTTTYGTTYLTSSDYNHSSFWAGTERLFVEGQSLDLDGFRSAAAIIPLKLPEDGASPDKGSPVNVLVLGGTETGIYPVADLQANWNPTRVEQSTGMLARVPAGYTLQQASEAPTFPYPLSSVVSILPGSTDYQVTIAVVNPFDLMVSATVAQSVPSNFTILDSGGAQVSGTTLIWSETLEPGTGLELRAILRWEAMPGETSSVPGPILTFQDPGTGQGDDYTASTETVSAAWPLDVTLDLPVTWQIGTMVTIPISLVNISSGMTVHGVLTSTVTSIDGQLLWSTERPVNVSAGQSQQLSLQFDVPAKMGYAVLSGAVNVGDAHQQVFQEVVYIRGYQTYLPIVVCEEDVS
jgi:hypothetical protein